MNPTETNCSHPSLKGCLSLPGDKSISHRALMFAALARAADGRPGSKRIDYLSAGADVQATMAALNQLGANIEPVEGAEGHSVIVHGRIRPDTVPDELVSVDCGNSGTTMRLLSGLFSGLNVNARLFGDASLSKRPMQRVLDPLGQMGATLCAETEPHFPPLRLTRRVASAPLHGIEYASPIASAQVKSAILLAGLFCPASETVRICEPEQSRDHTERMLAALGVVVAKDGLCMTLQGRADDLCMGGGATGQAGQAGEEASAVVVPADISSAAFWMVGAALLPGSAITFRRLGLNPSRLGLFEVMHQVSGVSFETGPSQTSMGEPYADVTVTGTGALKGDITIDRALVPYLVDEIPILTVLGLFTDGTFTVSGAEELRVKESDRLSAMVGILRRLGVSVDETADGYTFCGQSDFVVPVIDTPFETHHDHRLVMALEILNLRASTPLPIVGREWVQTSYPSFYADYNQLLGKPIAD
ncbi:MAG: 3-phosphoshikimate 1-carboxyvinyltransferase [Cyanobacteria bacterium HKST-UBA04]|nr:3-phosphoshikimate 1-carboxyvinyltransferase [Cyanobacteria bacterium HKST-UBA04]